MRRKNGYFIFIVLIMIVVIGLMGMLMTYLFSNRVVIGVKQENALKAFYNAESGIQIAERLITTPGNPLSSYRITCAGLNAYAPVTNASLNGGTFTLTTLNNHPYWAVTTLSGAALATDTTISAASTTGFAPKGRIQIDNEVMDYNAISGNTFVNVIRGTSNTTAVAHVSGAGVGQYQCTVDSAAGIPNLTTPTYREEIQNAVQLQWAFTIGDLSGSSCAQGIYNWTTASPPIEGSWTNYTYSCPASYTGSFFLSYADGWIIGQTAYSNLLILHGNGDSYNIVTMTPAIVANLYGVFCNASNDCWFVGSAVSNYPTIVHWNGSTLTKYTPTAHANASLNSVYCNNTNDCWAVGGALSNYPLIEHWNGTNWSLVTPTATANTALNSVFCNSSSNCYAVGNAINGNPLIEYYNGTSWTLQTPATTVNVGLNSVYCNNSTDCWAVGNVNGSNPLILHWTGSSWSSYTPASSSAISLYSVSCFSRSDCWAVGQNARFVHWDSSTWAYVTAPSGMPSVTLRSLSTVGAGSSSSNAISPMSSWTRVFA